MGSAKRNYQINLVVKKLRGEGEIVEGEREITMLKSNKEGDNSVKEFLGREGNNNDKELQAREEDNNVKKLQGREGNNNVKELQGRDGDIEGEQR